MSYSYDKFLRPITTTDKNIQIIDNTGIVKYTINPFSIVNVMISNNLLKINMRQSRTILINFSSTNEAKLAISKLQEQIDILTEKTPLFIDKQIANYVDDRINSILIGVGATGPQGPTGADGGVGVTGSQGATGSTGAVSFGTSSTPLQIPAIGYVTSLNLQPNLAFTPMQTVIAYSNLTDNYMIDDYVEGDTGTYFIGQIESYDYISGDMSIIVDYSSGYGLTDSNGQIATYSLWYVNLSGRDGSADVFLGGTLSNTLQWHGNSYDFIATEFDNIVFTSSVYDVVSDFISLDSTDSIQVLADYDLTLNAGGQLSLSGDSGLVSIGNTQGLVYQSDYSSGFVTQSLVDKGYVDTMISSITVNDENTIYVRKQGGDFLTIKEAVDSITTASSSNAYVIKVGGGVYQEEQIQMKSYVSVVGESSVSTIIEAIDPNSTLIIGADQSIIADCQIQGCTGFEVAAVEYSSPTTPQRDAIFYVENVRFGENYTNARVIGTTSGLTAGNCIMQCSNVKYGGYPFTLGFHVTNNGTTAADGIGRMQLRNVTSTNGGISTTSGLVFAKADKPGCAFIVNGCLLTKSVGAAAGIGFHIENGGVLRATSVNLQRWAKGIYVPEVGTVASSIDALAVNFEGCTKDVEILDPKTTGKIQGTDNYSKTNIILSAPFYEVNKDPRIITVAKKGGDFTSLSSAVNSITDSGEDNRYVIKVGPGKYTENEINLIGKSYVSIVGSDIQTTTIEPIYETNSVFVLGDTNELSFMTIQGAGTGYAGIECVDINGFSLAHKISMYDCDTMILVRCTDLSTPVQFFGEYLDINGTYTYGIKVESTVDPYDVSSNGNVAFANFENYFVSPTVDAISNYVSGIGTQLTVQGGSLTGIKSTDTGFYLENGASLSLTSIDIMGFDKALHFADGGDAPSFECVGVIIKDSSGSVTKDMLIEHPSTFGFFQGVSDHNKISNLSPNVSWSFLDGTDGEFDITKKISVTFYEEGNPGGIHTDLSSIIFDGSPMGVISGSTMSHVSGLVVNILDGTGYIQGTSSEGIVKNIHYIGASGQTFSVPDNSSEYVYLYDDSGNIYSTSSLPNTEQNIIFGRVVTSNGEVVFVDRSPIKSKHQSNKNTNFNRQAIGSVYEYGSIVNPSSTPFELDVTSGSYFFGNTNFKPSGGDSITFKEFYSDGSGGWIITSTSNVNTKFDNSGTLTSLTSGFTKHSLYVVGDGTEEQYLLVLGQEEHLTQLDTELGSIPTPPDYFTEGVTLLANIYIKAGSSSIFQIEDMRNLGFKSSARLSELDKINNSIQLVKDSYLPLDGGVMSGNLEIEGTFSSTGLTELSEVIEVINSAPTGATAATVTYDFSGGSIFYHGTASQNYTADFINIPTTNNRTITTTIILSQGSVAYTPTVVKIDGITQSVKWAGGTYSGTANGVDIIGFTFIRTSSTWTQVLGQINPFS